MEWSSGNLTAKGDGFHSVLKVGAVDYSEKRLQNLMYEIDAYFGNGINHTLGGFMNCIDVSGVSEEYRSRIVGHFALLDEHSHMKTGVRGLSERQAKSFEKDNRILVLSDDYISESPLLAECIEGLAAQ